jgi:ectoine hydroxylase-related dioxygenase (phytanoyl-CoA dioxygenase family)
VNVLKESQKEFYEDQGYLLLEEFVSEDWLERLNRATAEFIEESRSLRESSARILVEPSHTPDAPRLRRIPHTVAVHPEYEAFGLQGPLIDIAEDLLGPDIRFHHSKLNFKWHSGGEAVDWHQDIQFWPHTNYSPLTIGVYLEDVTDEMGPMGIVPGSHRRDLFDLADEAGNWTGSINRTDLARVDLDSVAWLKGPKGSVTVHSSRSIHGSKPNESERMRPLLLHTYAPADARPVTDLVDRVPLSNVMVRGQEAAEPRFETDPPCPMPPSFKPGEYKSIFSVQQQEG